uniref:HAT C-terminal dimerisation domain-containing protein n=1 Tax=Glycine max TaxID=3847 RepID=K7M7F5_SOYBN
MASWLSNQLAWASSLLQGLNSSSHLRIRRSKGCDSFKEDIAAICRFHVVVKYVKSSPSRLSKFKECVVHVNIEYKGLVRLDVETRWNSTYLMLDAILKHHNAFEEFELRDKKFMGMAPTYNDWEFVHSIFPFLEIFYDATLCISGSSHATSTMYMFEAFGIGMKIKEMSTSRGVNMSVRTMVVRMKERYDKYWGNPNRINSMARDMLAILIFTLASESVFSTKGRVLDPNCCSLTPQMMETLVCTQDWIKRTPSPLPSNENEEFLEFEIIEEVIMIAMYSINLEFGPFD